MKNILPIMLASFVVLSGCGGGGSSSGGGSAQMQNDVTSCIRQETMTSVDFFGNTIEDITFTNTCDFNVNLALATVVGLSSDGLLTLAPNESFTRRSLFVGEIIACRPPSVAMDTDDSINVSLACS